MEHQKYLEWIQLSFYNELGKEEMEELEKHLSVCSECKAEYEEEKKLFSVILKEEKAEPDDELLNDARRQLRTALSIEENRKTPGRNFSEILNSFFTFNYKFALSGAVILLIGFFTGYLVFYSSPKTFTASSIEEPNQNKEVSLAQENVQITNLHLINKNPESGEIEFTFDAVRPMKMKGNINDTRIQSILTYSILNSENPGVRLNSINAISETKKGPLDNDVKEALIRVVKFDENPGVRREAMKALSKFPYDDEIKHAYLYVLSNDTTSGMRIEAINNLFQAKKDGYSFNKQELSVFKKKVETDNNNYIRYRAQTVLQEIK
jgi:hypothetical protein